MPHLPLPRGPISEQLLSRLVRRPHAVAIRDIHDDRHALSDEDLQLALHVLYGLHVDGFDVVDDNWEWEPSLIRVRTALEHGMLAGLRDEVDASTWLGETDVARALHAIIGNADSRSLSGFIETEAVMDQLRELVIHRSIYQRKEADAHTFAIPRLRGVAKSAMVRIQADEYGDGKPGRSHAELFAATMNVLELDPSPGAYIDLVPATTLATDNLVSLFSLHRARRAELVGHLALFEMTSVIPMGRYARGMRRLTRSERAAEFYDVHVLADEVHARWAADELAAGLVDDEPELLPQVLFGAAALMHVEAAFTDLLLDRWARGASSLRTESQPLDAAVESAA